MATIKVVCSRASIGTVINYITKKEKTEVRLVSGINCSPETAIDEMKFTKELWNKTGGRQYKHYVQSFPPDEDITPEQAHKIAMKLCREKFSDYEVMVATHKDRAHIHSHIVVNSVSCIDGHKIQESKKDLQALKDYSDKLCIENGLSICTKNNQATAYKKEKYKAIEKAVTGENGYKSYLTECYKAVKNVAGKAVSREDFISKLKQLGYETVWSNRKYITFINADGKKIRNSNLTKTFKDDFGKEALENGFKINDKRKRMSEYTEQRLTAIRLATIDREIECRESTIQCQAERVGENERRKPRVKEQTR
jgi:hypothetical protein